jgi:hypothetical protein
MLRHVALVRTDDSEEIMTIPSALIQILAKITVLLGQTPATYDPLQWGNKYFTRT